MPHKRRLGMITGPVTLRDSRGSHDLRASVWHGPNETSHEGISIIEHDAKVALLVEKTTIFDQLLKTDFATKNQCILLCGGGYPGRTFLRLVGQLHNQLRLPFYVLADNDPAGYELLLLLARQIPAIAYLGLRVRDYELLAMSEVAQITLSDAEREQIHRLKAHPSLRSDAAWQLDLDSLLRRGFKVEMEALMSVSASCLAEDYLPKRLAARDHLRIR